MYIDASQLIRSQASIEDTGVASRLQELNSKWYEVRDNVRGQSELPASTMHVHYSGRIIATADSWAIFASIADVVGAALNAFAASKLENAGTRVTVNVNGDRVFGSSARRAQKPLHRDAGSAEQEEDQKKKEKREEVSGLVQALGLALLTFSTVLVGQAYSGWGKASEDRAFAEGLAQHLEDTEEYHAGYDVALAVSKFARHGSIKILRHEESSFRYQTLNMVALLTFSGVTTAAAFGQRMPLVRIGMAGFFASALVALFRTIASDPAGFNKRVARELVFEVNEGQAKIEMSRDDFKTWLENQHTPTPNFAQFCQQNKVPFNLVATQWDSYRSSVLGYGATAPSYTHVTQQPPPYQYAQGYPQQPQQSPPAANPYANSYDIPPYQHQAERATLYPELNVNVDVRFKQPVPSAPSF